METNKTPSGNFLWQIEAKKHDRDCKNMKFKYRGTADSMMTTVSRLRALGYARVTAERPNR